MSFQGMSFNTGSHQRMPEYRGPGADHQRPRAGPGPAASPDLQDRLEVWVGDTSYPARPIKSDDTLAMTIIKLETDDRFTPLDAAPQAADLAPRRHRAGPGADRARRPTTSCSPQRVPPAGARWAAATAASPCYGLPRDARGALVLDRRGEPAGLATASPTRSPWPTCARTWPTSSPPPRAPRSADGGGQAEGLAGRLPGPHQQGPRQGARPARGRAVAAATPTSDGPAYAGRAAQRATWWWRSTASRSSSPGSRAKRVLPQVPATAAGHGVRDRRATAPAPT
jgi:hypothetical protein